MANTNGTSSLETLRITYGFRIVIVGLLMVATVFGVAVLRFETAADVAAGVGSVSGVVGTVVGAFFGIQVGAAGKDKAEEEREQALKQRDFAQSKVERLIAIAPKDEAIRILEELR